MTPRDMLRHLVEAERDDDQYSAAIEFDTGVPVLTLTWTSAGGDDTRQSWALLPVRDNITHVTDTR